MQTVQTVQTQSVQTVHAARHLRTAARARRQLRPKLLLTVADLLAVSLAVSGTVLARLAVEGEAIDQGELLIMIGTPVLWVAALFRQGSYTTRRIALRLQEARRITRASVTTLALLAVLSVLLDREVSRLWFGVLGAAGLGTLLVERELARRIFTRMRRDGLLRRRVVMVGTNTEAKDLERLVADDPTTGYHVVGFVSINSAGESRDRVSATISDTLDMVRDTNASGVIIPTTAITTDVSNRLVRELTNLGIHVELSSTLRDLTVERLTVGSIGPCPTIYIEPVRLHGWRAAAKRAFDIVLSSSCLVLTAPLLLATALAVKVTTPGPVLFRQVRLGKGGNHFEVLKFRTMVMDAEAMLPELQALNEAEGPLFKIRHDPRVTRVGALLRRTSLDELPQLWNVLRGEMSLVGPRPALPKEALLWEADFHDRLRVSPGITGMWQVNGRSNASHDAYVRLDLFYVDNWSLLTDLTILAKTIPAVLSSRGAY